jgi:hypothetical protein
MTRSRAPEPFIANGTIHRGREPNPGMRAAEGHTPHEYGDVGDLPRAHSACPLVERGD